MKSERNINIEILRIISALAVVTIHVTTKYITDNNLFGSGYWDLANILNNVSRYAVPMFFIISGYFTLNNDKNRNYSLFFTKKLRRVIFPFLIWSVLYTIFHLVSIGNFDLLEFLKRILTLIFGYPAYYHLWYFYELIGLYIVTPIIIKFFDKLGLREIIILVSIFVFQNTLIDMFNKILNANSYLDIPFSGYALFYYLLGGLWGKFGIEFLIKKKKLILFISFLSIFINILGTKILSEETGEINSIFLSNHVITIMLYSIGIFTYVMNLKLKYLSSKMKEVIIKIASLSLGVYLIHPFVIDFIIEPINFSKKSILVIVLELILTWIISCIITLMIKKAPLVNKIIP